MTGITALPQHEPVMVLHGKNDHLHARRFHCLTPLVRVQLLQVKGLGTLLPRSPFHPGKRIRAEMDERNEFIVQSFPLIGCGHDMRSFGHDLIVRVRSLDPD